MFVDISKWVQFDSLRKLSNMPAEPLSSIMSWQCISSQTNDMFVSAWIGLIYFSDFKLYQDLFAGPDQSLSKQKRGTLNFSSLFGKTTAVEILANFQRREMLQKTILPNICLKMQR